MGPGPHSHLPKALGSARPPANANGLGCPWAPRPASPSFLPMADVPPPLQEGRPPGREPGCPGPPRCPSCSSGPGVGQALGRASCGRWEQGQAAVTWGSGSPPGFWNQAARAWVPTAWDRPARRQLKALPLPAPLPWAKACLGSRLVPPGSGSGCQASPFPSGNDWFVEPSPSTCRPTRTARRACPAPAWPLGAGRGRDFPLSRAAPALPAPAWLGHLAALTPALAIRLRSLPRAPRVTWHWDGLPGDSGMGGGGGAGESLRPTSPRHAATPGGLPTHPRLVSALPGGPWPTFLERSAPPFLARCPVLLRAMSELRWRGRGRGRQEPWASGCGPAPTAPPLPSASCTFLPG